MPSDRPLISTKPEGHALVVAVHVPSLDSTNTMPVQNAIEAVVLETPARAIVLDLGEVETMGSAGLGALVHLFTLCQQGNRRFGICGARLRTAEILRMARMDRLFPAYGSVADFLQAMRLQTR